MPVGRVGRLAVEKQVGDERPITESPAPVASTARTLGAGTRTGSAPAAATTAPAGPRVTTTVAAPSSRRYAATPSTGSPG